MITALPFLLCYVSSTLYLALYDLRTGLLPDRVTCPLLWIGLVFHQYFFPARLADALWGAVAGYMGFAGLYWTYRFIRGQEGLGYGDVKFLAALGAWHGWPSLPLLVLCASLLASLCVAAETLIRGKRALKNPLPFGPFLAAAGFITGCHQLMTGGISL
ncbi:prepilin peptidase [Citrobacter sedlakii]|uniref:prepilin peptidase n=1 Tax=Citrobacter sedlakii TaxID=67826 RepID=UPI002B229E7B|nr:A24 family peptidase [Citrobacter sedlakii]MEB0953017.1 A24 family peptidase [Citrobacter sedlakii]